MRPKNFSVISVILLSVGLTACGPKTVTNPDIFNTLSQSEFFTSNAAEIECEDDADFPSKQYHRLCFKFKSITIPNLDEAGKIGLNLGLETQALFKDLDWKAKYDDPEKFWYAKLNENGCIEKLFLVFSEIDKMDSDDGNFPMQFSPIFSFSKSRQLECEKI